MRFSQRIGITPAQKIVQKDSIDNDLRNGLWNVLTIFYWDRYKIPSSSFYGRSDYVEGSNLETLVSRLWIHFYKKPTDTIETFWEYCLKYIRDKFFGAKWNEIYDFIEFVAHKGPEDRKQKFIDACNFHLERENSAYRFVEGRIVEITSTEEIEAVEDAIRKAAPFPGVKEHLSSALDLLADKTSPDFRNSIKESISAIESLAKHIAEDDSATLGAVLKHLERKKTLHPALNKAFSALYGYTSDADGIRHALMEKENLSKSDARFMLVCCSAFVNYIIDLLSG